VQECWRSLYSSWIDGNYLRHPWRASLEMDKRARRRDSARHGACGPAGKAKVDIHVFCFNEDLRRREQTRQVFLPADHPLHARQAVGGHRLGTRKSARQAERGAPQVRAHHFFRRGGGEGQRQTEAQNPQGAGAQPKVGVGQGAPNRRNSTRTLAPQKITFRFLYQPEYLVIGKKIIINEANFKLIGEISHIAFDTYKNSGRSIPKKNSKMKNQPSTVLEKIEDEVQSQKKKSPQTLKQ